MTLTPELYFFTEGIAVAFFTIMAMQNLWTREIRLRMILGWILLYWAVQHVASLAFIDEFFATNGWNSLVRAADMTAEPTCCFLLVELCRPGWLTWRKVIVHETPFVLLGLTYLITGVETWYTAMIVFFVLYGCGTFVAILYYLPKYNKFLRAHYSYDENVNLRWIYVTLFTFYLLMFTYAGCGVNDSVLGDFIYVAGSVASWAWICFCIWRQEAVLSELKETLKEEKKTLKEEEETDDLLAAVIEARFIRTKLFLNPKLKLGDVAAAVGTNRTYLSRYLNAVLHSTFYDYVNGLRLDHACSLMKETDYSITAIAQMSGFNSYSTFRRAFIAKFGISPTSWGDRKHTL